MAMYRCTSCGFKGISANVRSGGSDCPVCGYSRGHTEPSADDIAIARRILRISPKLKRHEFPFEFSSVPLVKRPRVIDWLIEAEESGSST
ncbi:MAG: hypothetical protein NTZ34_06320 [Chloroflexi bacterium]|nr:hypothetical protein [Chloroflexota bacterium]